MKDLLVGVAYLREGFALLGRPGLRRFVIMPLLVNVLLFGGLIWWAFGWVEATSQYLVARLPGWLEWLSYLVVPVFVLTCLVLIFYGFSVLANLIAAPFNGLLAEAVEARLTGKPLQGDWRQVLRDVLPSLFSELRKLLYFAVRAVPLGLLFLIPGVNLAAPFLWALFSAWMLAIEYADYPMANHWLHFTAQRERLRSRRLLSYGFGGGSLLLTMIPVVNFLAMPASVAGATAMWVREFRESE